MNRTNILVVDDEWNMRNLLRIYLTRSEWNVAEASSGQDALNMLEQTSFDLVILDLMMPGIDGFEVCTEIRKKSNVPILMLTARTETKDKVQGLNLGADDYLTKPFDPDELIARVYALLRRMIGPESVVPNPSSYSNVILLPEMTIDPEGRQIMIHEKLLDLTPKEFELMYTLTSNRTRVYSREHLLSIIWGDEYFGDERTVDTHIKSLRGKVKKAGLSYNPIFTVWGVGYKFQGPEEVSNESN
jgi:two-component system response regulator ResD